MFTLLSGRFVREAETVNEELALAVTARAPSVATVVPDLHPAVVELVDKTLAYEKDVRWPDARAMQLAVRQAYAAMRAPGADAPSLPRAPQASVVSEVEAGPAASTLAASTAGSVSVSAPPARSGLRVGLAAGAVVAIGLVVAGVTLLGGRSPAPAAAGPDAQATVATVVTAAPAVSPSASAEPAGASAAATASAAPSASTSASATASPAAATASATATATAAPRNVPAKRDPFSRRK
jgi:serine/threonine-protein kinase